MANKGELLTKEIKKLKNKIWLPLHRTYVESTQDAHKSSLNVFTKSYAKQTQTTFCAQGVAKRHRNIYTYKKYVMITVLVADPGSLKLPE